MTTHIYNVHNYLDDTETAFVQDSASSLYIMLFLCDFCFLKWFSTYKGMDQENSNKSLSIAPLLGYSMLYPLYYVEKQSMYMLGIYKFTLIHYTVIRKANKQILAVVNFICLCSITH